MAIDAFVGWTVRLAHAAAASEDLVLATSVSRIGTGLCRPTHADPLTPQAIRQLHRHNRKVGMTVDWGAVRALKVTRRSLRTSRVVEVGGADEKLQG
jgi:glutamate 5-kinase